jgi:hypothetical protein
MRERSMSRTLLWHAVALGAAAGVVYTLSPLAVCFAFAMIGLLAWSANGVDDRERLWIWRLLIAAVALKAVFLSGMFLMHGLSTSTVPSFFGDEAYFKKRALLLRSIALHVRVSPEDIVDAFDEYSATSYLYVLAYLQVLFGPSPFGIHLFNWAISFAAAVLLYKAVRPSFGSAASLLALGITLFLPSLFIWSTSALKEPLFLALTTTALVAGATMLRAGSWPRRLMAAAVCIAATMAAETVRANSIAGVSAGLLGAVIGRFILPRPRFAVVCVLATLMIGTAALTRPSLRDRMLQRIRAGAASHRGHVLTAGYTYKLLDEKYYGDVGVVSNMPWEDAIPYAGRALVAYALVPLPWQIHSTEAALYIPEQMVWYALLVMAPIGVLAGIRRDPTITMMLVAFAGASALGVGLSSGNIGTLIRHRGITITYLVWLSALGACELLRGAVRARQANVGIKLVGASPERSLHALD